jgi:hypothetical protein
MRRGELTTAQELVKSSHEMSERHDDPFVRLWGQVQTTGTLGAIRRDGGDHVSAYALLARSGELAREAGIRWWEAQSAAELAAVSLTLRRTDDAARHAREALRLAGDPFCKVFAVGVLAGVAAEQGQHERAGQLWGTIEGEDAVSPLGGWRRFRPACATYVQAATGSAFDRGQAEGRTWTLDQAVALALEVPAGA